MKLEVGQHVDRYTVDALIGAGGTAMVYRVRHNQLHTWHALKVLTITSEAIRERMIREGQVQASLRHLNIVTVTDVLDLDGAPGLLMEYVEGPSLERALGQFRIRMGDAETLFLGVVSGVRQAHMHGLVHRDLKPANVLLARTSEGFVPKVTDFGLAKLLQDEPGVAHTRSGIAMGTPSYMAPEQIRDARTVDQRADLWSLGCILYELVLRRRAFPGEEALPIYNAVTVGDYVPPREILADLPNRVDLAIRGCLTVDRARRIPDCETLIAVLQGRQSWDVSGATRVAVREVPAPPPSLASDVPDMPVAARRKDGTTPRPPPPRASSAPVPAATVAMGLSPAPEPASDGPETIALPSVGVDGTLDASDSLETVQEDPERTWLGLLALGFLAFVVGSGVLLVVLAVVGSMFLHQGTRSAPAEGTVETTMVAPTPSHPAPEVPEPKVETPEPVRRAPERAPPEPVARVTPRPKAAPRPEPAVEPAPAPAPAAPPAPVPVEVKLLSVPPTATLRINGQAAGRTPAKLDLPPGRHTVQIQSGENTGWYEIVVRDGAENKWCYAFSAATNHAGSCP